MPSSKTTRRAVAGAAAALNPRKPRRPRVLSDIKSYDKEESGGGTDDRVLQYLLRQRGGKSFQCLEEIDPLIDEHRKRSQNKMKIKKSSPDSLCLYVCTEHAKCCYQIFVGNCRDGFFVMKQTVSKLCTLL